MRTQCARFRTGGREGRGGGRGVDDTDPTPRADLPQDP